ncbi:MAG: ABC transporter ATP-binding protein [Pseudomonadota bacterium]
MFLEISGLDTFYGSSHVLRGVSLQVGGGEIVALLGRNGMGKSTTLKSVIGLVKPRSGAIVFKGANIRGLPPHRVARAGIGYVPEERRIFPNLTVLDNLLMGMKGGGGNQNGPGDWTIERIYETFPSLKKRRDNKGAHLSGGEQQMLAIGRALMGNPSLLLVDEPTEGLAPIIVQAVQEVLAEINRAGVSILLVEHNLKVALNLARRVYLMGKAHIGFSGTVEELEAAPETKAAYLEV